MARMTSVDNTRNMDHAFDQFLSTHEKIAPKALEQFGEAMQKSQIKYGRFTIPSFLKAHFITPKQEKLFKTVSDAFLTILNKVISLYFTEPMIAQHFHLPKELEELIKIDPGYSHNVVILRLDGFSEGESLKFVDLNCDGPAGMVYADQLEKIFFEIEPLKGFFDEFHFHREDRCQKILSALLNIYEEFGGLEAPNIAIVDWRTVRTKSEFDGLKAFFEEKGYKTTIADPRELRYRTGKLYHGNFKIDLVYRRALTTELLDHAEEVGDLIKAYRDRAICMVNPLRSCLASNNALLSILTNPAFDHFFTDKENELKREHLPWTRQVADAEQFYGRRKIYLIDFLKDEKETLVLKPSVSASGREVVIGNETRDEDWNAAIDRALKGNWMVQEFVNVPKMTVPAIVNHKLDFQYKRVSIGLFVFDWKFAGGLSKLGDDTVINISRGGGLIPAIASEETVNR